MTRPPAFKATPWHFPSPEIISLPNGLTVWHFAQPRQHVATMETVFHAPLSNEPAGKDGVATVALHALDEGTQAHPDGEIGRLLERHGALLHGKVYHRYTTFGAQAPSRRLNDVLPLYTEVLQSPAYASQDIAHHVEAQIAGYDSKLASPAQASRIALARCLFGPGHRAGRPASGSPRSLKNLTPTDVTAWHTAAFSPIGATLILAGAVQLEEVTEPLSSWAGPEPSLAPPPVAPRPTPAIVVVDHPGAVQAAICLGIRTVTRDDPAWPALRIAGHAIAGAFASRFNLELRERLGYTYGIHGGFTPGPTEGQFTVSGSVRNDVAAESVRRLLDGLVMDRKFTGEEIADAQQYLVRTAPLANETSADIVSQAAALAAAGLDTDYLGQHYHDLEAVVADDATTAFRQAVTPDEVSIAITGDAETLIPALLGIGIEATVADLQDQP